MEEIEINKNRKRNINNISGGYVDHGVIYNGQTKISLEWIDNLEYPLTSIYRDAKVHILFSILDLGEDFCYKGFEEQKEELLRILSSDNTNTNTNIKYYIYRHYDKEGKLFFYCYYRQ